MNNINQMELPSFKVPTAARRTDGRHLIGTWYELSGGLMNERTAIAMLVQTGRDVYNLVGPDGNRWFDPVERTPTREEKDRGYGASLSAEQFQALVDQGDYTWRPIDPPEWVADGGAGAVGDPDDLIQEVAGACAQRATRCIEDDELDDALEWLEKALKIRKII